MVKVEKDNFKFCGLEGKYMLQKTLLDAKNIVGPFGGIYAYGQIGNLCTD